LRPRLLPLLLLLWPPLLLLALALLCVLLLFKAACRPCARLRTLVAAVTHWALKSLSHARAHTHTHTHTHTHAHTHTRTHTRTHTQDLKESLELLGSVPPDALVAVELLWTPQERGDAYSKDELLVDYPGLMNL
jgi:hypothetical protein